MKNKSPSRNDHVDAVLSEWKQQRPHLNQSSTALLSRLGRLNIAVGRELEALLARFNLTRAEYDVLATLRRKGPPFRQPLKVLLPSLMRTSGTVTFRLDRLEEKGFVRREADSTDRRSITVILTESGESLFDSVQPLHLADGNKLLFCLSKEEQIQFVGLLKKMLLVAERNKLKGLNDFDIALLQRYGFHFAANDGDPGPLRVQHVIPHGPAERGGLRQDDVVICASGQPVSSTDLPTERLLSEPASDAPLQITVLRNGRRHTLSLDPHPS